MAHLDAGRLHALPWRGFDAQDVTAAFRLMQQSGHIGKIIIRPPAAGLHDAVKRVRADASYLIVGGLGGFGLALARRLAQRGAGRIILVSRRGHVDEAAAAIMADMRALGTEIVVCAADASLQSDLDSVIADISPDKPLRGVFHTAMTLADALISNLDEARIASVLRSKIDVAVCLERAAAHHALDWFVLFSSAAALLGNPGQAHYAAANAWLEGMARRRRATGLVALAIGWGAISDVGYLTRGGEAGRALLARLARHALSSGEALDSLESLLAADDLDPETAAVVVARLDWAALSRDLPILATPLFKHLRTERDANAQAGGLSAELMLMSDDKARARILTELTSAIGKIMRLPDSEIDVTQPLASLGVDSLMGVELRLAAEERFNVDVPLLSIGAAGSLADLGGLILKQMRTTPQVPDA
jgi:NAD(P)-dependent dehydrogenase (short-subunit alcohol dehydrogenase family)/acyl carrier protein